MAISYVGSAEVIGATVTLPSHQTGDLFIGVASGGLTVPSGWMLLGIMRTIGGVTQGIVCYKFAASGSETNPTFTSSQYSMVSVYRGVGCIGDVTGIKGTTLVTYGALSFNISGDSWVVGVGIGDTTTAGTAAPTGMTNRQNGTANPGNTYFGTISDTNGNVTSWTQQTVDTTDGTTTMGWTIQLLPSGREAMLPKIESVTQTILETDSTSFSANMPATVNAGDLLVMVVGIEAGNTLTSDPSGWTRHEHSAGFSNLCIWTKKADGTEGGTTVGLTADGNAEWSSHVLLVANWFGSLLGVVDDGGVQGASDPINFGSLTPGWSGPTLWIAPAHCYYGGTAKQFDEWSKDARVVDETTRQTTAARPILMVQALVTDGESTLDPGNSGTNGSYTASGWRTFTLAIRGKDVGALFWAFP